MSINNSENQNCGPIFIVGCPRSGNTLLGCILNKHPELIITFEGNYYTSVFKDWKSLVDKKNDKREAFIKSVLLNLRDNPIINSISFNYEKIESYLIGSDDEWGSLLDHFMHSLSKDIKGTANRWGDKTPHHLAYMGKIYKEFPNAKFIYVYRDPRHSVISLSKSTFIHASNSEIINAEVVKHYYEFYVSEKNKIPKNTIYELRYENLIFNPENELIKLCEFLGIKYNSKLLDPAPPEIRTKIGWENYKGWNKLEAQKSRKEIFNIKSDPEIYLIPLNRFLGYDIKNDLDSKIKYKSKINLNIFKMIRVVLEKIWKIKYPYAGPYIMNKYPSLTNILSWLKLK